MNPRVTSSAFAGVKSMDVEAVVIRADGRRQDLGRVAYWHRNPIKRFLGGLRVRRGEVPA